MSLRATMKPSASEPPSLLVSYAYLARFRAVEHGFEFRDWALDSGAFTAKASGRPIVLSDYIAKCQELLASDPKLVEVFALDVIGDHRASLKNAETMRAAGVDAIPTFHHGEPWSALEHMAKEFPKIALGGVARMKAAQRRVWLEQCFARVWPKKIHGFGMASESLVLGLPFHSVDATSWELGPCGFGNWRSFGNMSVRGGNQDLRAEVEWYLRLERAARSRWRREMDALESSGAAPVIRLAVVGGRSFAPGRAKTKTAGNAGQKPGGQEER